MVIVIGLLYYVGLGGAVDFPTGVSIIKVMLVGLKGGDLRQVAGFIHSVPDAGAGCQSMRSVHTVLCIQDKSQESVPTLISVSPTAAPTQTFSPTQDNKWCLWSNGTQLRGANIYQRRVYVDKTVICV